VRIYTSTPRGLAMMQFDLLPPRLREIVRENPDISAGFLLVALDDEMTEDEIVHLTKQGTAWWIT
jgi:hypothetical protein